MNILNDPNIRAQFWGSFFAALFALLTFAITQSASAVRRRNRDHYNFLVKMESKLNHHLSHIFPIIYVIQGVQETTKNGNVSFNNIDALTLEPVGEFHDLLDIDLINSLFSYDTGLETLNTDLSNLSATYSEFRSALITKQITIAEFKTILPNLPDDLGHLVRSWEEHLENTIDLLVQTRLMMKRDEKKLRGLNWLFVRHLKPLTQRDINAEKLKLMQEMEEIRRQSQRRIEKLNRK
jgi:hypothetical protein